MLGLVKLHKFHTSVALKPVQVPLDAIASWQCVNCPTQPGAVSDLAEGALDPSVRVPDKDVT